MSIRLLLGKLKTLKLYNEEVTQNEHLGKLPNQFQLISAGCFIVVFKFSSERVNTFVFTFFCDLSGSSSNET